MTRDVAGTLEAALDDESPAVASLAYRLHLLRLVLESGETRFEKRAAGDALRAARAARVCDLHRVLAAERFAAEVDAPPGLLTLPLIAERCDPDVRARLIAHSSELWRGLDEVDEVARVVTALASKQPSEHQAAAAAAARAGIPALREFLGDR